MSRLITLAKQFRFNEKLLSMLTQDFEEEDWLTRAGDSGASLWILAHLVSSRRYLLRLLGETADDEPWEKIAAMGSKDSDGSGLPSPGALAKAFTDAGERIEKRTASMSDEEADGKIESAFPDGSDTRAGGAAFLFMHESYHLGQIGLLRRICGKQGIV